MKDLILMGIQIVEKLELVRKKYNKCHALYMICPRSDSVNALIKDFVNEGNSIQYHKIHIFFMNRVPEELLQKIRAQKAVV